MLYKTVFDILAQIQFAFCMLAHEYKFNFTLLFIIPYRYLLKMMVKACDLICLAFLIISVNKSHPFLGRIIPSDLRIDSIFQMWKRTHVPGLTNESTPVPWPQCLVQEDLSLVTICQNYWENCFIFCGCLDSVMWLLWATPTNSRRAVQHRESESHV